MAETYTSKYATGAAVDAALDLAVSALQPGDVDDTPVNGVTDAPVSSNWAFDHAANLNAHGISDFGETLVDDANDAAARTTLGLGDSATKNTGTTAGTVAAGDDSRITGAATAANLTTETDNRVLYDEELTRAVTYATDLAGQATRTLSGSLPNNVPASASAPGVAGQMRYASGFLYVCVAANTWQRVAIATWA
jgi:hypothetical protein